MSTKLPSHRGLSNNALLSAASFSKAIASELHFLASIAARTSVVSMLYCQLRIGDMHHLVTIVVRVNLTLFAHCTGVADTHEVVPFCQQVIVNPVSSSRTNGRDGDEVNKSQRR